MNDHTTNTPSQVKTCTKCGEIKPATTEYFSPHKSGRYGIESRCKTCKAWQARQYSANNQDRIREYRHSKRDHYIRLCHERRQTKPNHARAYEANKRAIKKHGAQGTLTPEDIALQYQSQDGKCFYCSEEVTSSYHIDHVIPLSRGGTNHPHNVVIACRLCNYSKRDKLPFEWREIYASN